MADVPCGKCRACCRDHTVVLLADDEINYQSVIVAGMRALPRKANGDCVYLGAKGCTIHDRAPAMCRAFDCRLALLRMMRHPENGPPQLTDDVLVAAHKRLHTLTIAQRLQIS